MGKLIDTWDRYSYTLEISKHFALLPRRTICGWCWLTTFYRVTKRTGWGATSQRIEFTNQLAADFFFHTA